jgi:hypothetical protein
LIGVHARHCTQTVDDQAQAKPKYFGGRKAARIKSGILAMSLWTTSHPTFCLPMRKHRPATAPKTAPDQVATDKAGRTAA